MYLVINRKRHKTVGELFFALIEVALGMLEIVHKREEKMQEPIQEKLNHSCSSCGTKLYRSYAYCPKCGHATAEASLVGNTFK